MLWRRIVTQASFLLVCSQSLIATADTYPAACGGLADRTVILRLCPRELLVPDSASFVESNDLAEIQPSRQSPSPVPQVLGQEDQADAPQVFECDWCSNGPALTGRAGEAVAPVQAAPPSMPPAREQEDQADAPQVFYCDWCGNGPALTGRAGEAQETGGSSQRSQRLQPAMQPQRY